MKNGAAAIDSKRGLFARTAVATSDYPGDLGVWLLANNNPEHPASNQDVPVQLVEANGTPVDMNIASSIAYDTVNDQFVIWDSRDRGTVWITQPLLNADGSVATTWTIRRAPSATSSLA